MKKIFLFCLLFFFSYSYSHALGDGTWYHSDGTSVVISWHNVKLYSPTDTLLNDYTFVPLFGFDLVDFLSIEADSNSQDLIVYIEDYWQSFYTNWPSNDLVFAPWVIWIYGDDSPEPTYPYYWYVVSWVGWYWLSTLSSLVTLDAQFSVPSNSSIPPVIVYRDEILSTTPPWPDLDCSIITQATSSVYSILDRDNVVPIETGDVLFEGVRAGTWVYIQFGYIKDIVNMVEMIEGTDVMTVKSSNAIFGEKPKLYIQSPVGITSIDLTHSDIWEATLYRYTAGGILQEQKIVDTSEIIIIPKTDYVIIEWGRSFFAYTIESIYISTEDITPTEKELCYNPETGDYTLDWNPTESSMTGSLSEIEDIPVEDWTFSTSGYTFFSNGFCLQNFVPYPSWGLLWFDIVDPTGKSTATEEYWPYATSGGWYWFDSCVKITTFYHEVVGTYKVRVKYTYNWTLVYPFGEDYNSYSISLPESNNNAAIVWERDSCWTDTWTFAWILNFFDCLNFTLSRVSSSITDSFQFLKVFLDIWNIQESKSWGSLSSFFFFSTSPDNIAAFFSTSPDNISSFFFYSAYADNTEIMDDIFWDSSNISKSFSRDSWVAFFDNISSFFFFSLLVRGSISWDESEETREPDETFFTGLTDSTGTKTGELIRVEEVQVSLGSVSDSLPKKMK